MDVSDVERFVAQGESETLELKKSTGELTAAMRTLCGFLNARGGIVVVGATPQGKLSGQEVSDGTQRDVALALARFEPAAPVMMCAVALPGTNRAALVLEASPALHLVPFTSEGRPYHRVGTTTTPMPEERYQRLLLERAHATTRWETAVAEGATLDGLDHEQVLRTVVSGVALRRLPASTGTDVHEILRKFGLLRGDGAVLNAAVVLFGNEEALRQYPQCELRLARFKGTDKSAFLDSRQTRGHVFVLLDDAEVFIQRHLPVAARIEPGRLQRVEEPLIPPDALREALVNAFAHRDYAIGGGAVSLAIYDDRWEVWSTGTLPFGMRVEQLTRDHESRPRNPLVADVLYRHGLVEKWGRGTQKIVELCVEAGRPAPEFVEQEGAVVVRFPTGEAAVPRVVGVDLTPRQREILAVLARAPDSAPREIMARMERPTPARTLRRELETLARLGVVRSSGQGPATRWSLA